MPKSETHDRAVLKQDNGELQEDVVASQELAGDTPQVGADGAGADEQARESFPASDPPSHWAGGGEAGRQGGDHTRPHGGIDRERLAAHSPVEEVPERAEPANPVPGTLPKD